MLLCLIKKIMLNYVQAHWTDIQRGSRFLKQKKKEGEEEASYSPTSFPLSGSLGFLNIRCC